MRNYVPVDAAYPYRMRGTLQQTDGGLLWQPPSYRAHQRGGAPTNVTLRTPGMYLGKYALHNRAAAAIVTGIGVRIPNYLWIAGQWTNATTTYTDDTAAAQNTTTDDFELETTTINDGYIIASRVPFNAVSINVSTASVDAVSVARLARFSTEAGTGWQTTEANVFIQDGSATNYATGENLFVFAPPVDWGRSVGLATGLPNGYYTMQMRTTDAAGTTAGVAASLEIFRLYQVTENVADNSIAVDDFFGGDLLMAVDDRPGGSNEVYGDALVALFSTANDQNRVTCQVRAA